MIQGLRLKVCGLTSLVDAQLADNSGADFLGFILHPASPRHVTLAQYDAMAERLPDRRRVAVLVEPEPAQLRAVRERFDYFQIHFCADLPVAIVAGWTEIVGRERLWLAPKVKPGESVPEYLLPQAKYFLLDTFRADGFGGTGRAGDWPQFAREQRAHPEHTWILAGGLGPDNVLAALESSGARFIDVNSGVEAAPGVKDPEKLRRLVAALRARGGVAPGR
ncbi:phosphoribosylanthranilate isomerase [Opitutus sp. ER46]|uniref:phosphoribosylanthranilate isomerase n=1 Tax=Opitutus sp. ER46 TaxID=2161864 RepID=UPI000D31A88C|nr:phosphoribosylanthranilate isomerase [Opitutus sp. ER46]PTX94265.1 phosphoribosylanthranilate isomerase [Opitutus sp. ER46]